MFQNFSNYGRGLIHAADSLTEPPENDWWHKYVLGLVAPIGVSAFLLWRSAGQTSGVWLAFVICAALFVHVQYFWSLTPVLNQYAELVKNILALPLIGLILYGGYVAATHLF